ncbi:uroporphyrinogen-III synthase [Psychrobacter sp. I-STPA10]|uniref:uroporphyrinogen-III synthase n=1 Tax=Psychrobacter sp. I-STPA10 TaxID=2585769 RepID=UPI001E452ED6|nr:uroporphyrinogen-III synthase [Psychrobacter sp. I-STPA10]
MSLLFVNTRPSERGSDLTDKLSAAGMDVVDLPLLSIQPLPFDAPDAQKMQQLLVGSYRILVVISPTAARMGLAQCPQDYVPDCVVIAVGEATANVLRQRGWQVQCPDESSNEGMLNMPMIQQLQSDNGVLIWRGAGGRRLLVDSLQERGIQVDIIEWYVRCCPKSLTQDYQQLCQKITEQQYNPIVVLISSGEAFLHWQTVVNHTTPCTVHSSTFAYNIETLSLDLDNFFYLVLGERLSRQVKALGLRYMSLDNLHSTHVLQQLQRL